MSPKVGPTSPATTASAAGRDAGRDPGQARAGVVRIVFGVLAAILALGALLVVLRDNVNEDNSVVKFDHRTSPTRSPVRSAATTASSHFTGKNAESKNALLNWGIAAIVYLLIGRVLART